MQGLSKNPSSDGGTLVLVQNGPNMLPQIANVMNMTKANGPKSVTVVTPFFRFLTYQVMVHVKYAELSPRNN